MSWIQLPHDLYTDPGANETRSYTLNGNTIVLPIDIPLEVSAEVIALLDGCSIPYVVTTP